MKGMKYLLLLSVFMVIPFAYAEAVYDVEIKEDGFFTGACLSKNDCTVELFNGEHLRVFSNNEESSPIQLMYTNSTHNGTLMPSFPLNVSNQQDIIYTQLTYDEVYYIISDDWKFKVIVGFPEEYDNSVNIESSTDEDGFTGWKQEGNEMVAYRLGQEITSYEIGALPTETRPEPSINTDAFNFSDDAGILSLRLQILQVFESILKILFGR